MLLGWIEITVLILVILLLVFRVGYRQWTKQMQMTEIAFQKVKSSFPEAQWTGSISYQGGLPEYPKPSLMNLALDTQHLILFKDDEFFQIEFKKIRKIEKFVTLRKDPGYGKSRTFMGPFANLFYKDEELHFIAIQYLDCNAEQNAILLVTSSAQLQKEMSDQLLDTYNQHFDHKKNGYLSVVKEQV